MKKHIRPITIFKQVNPMGFDICFNDITFSTPKTSKKNRENIGYWKYGWLQFKEAESHYNLPSFFFNEKFERNNICTITELGRLLLSGWYYGSEIEDFCREIANMIYNAYNRKRAQNDKFNDLEFSEALKEIRKNLIYYFHNPNEAKYYILEKLFKTELKKLLPPQPAELQKIEMLVEKVKTDKKKNERHEKDFYFFRAKFMERYSKYLKSKLTEAGIGFQSENHFQEIEDRYWSEEIKRIYRIETEYKKQAIKKINLNQLVETGRNL